MLLNRSLNKEKIDKVDKNQHFEFLNICFNLIL